MNTPLNSLKIDLKELQSDYLETSKVKNKSHTLIDINSRRLGCIMELKDRIAEMEILYEQDT